MTNLDQATKILENIQSEIDEVKKLLLPEENNAPEAAPAPSFEAEPKAEGGITSRLLNTFNTIKENVEAVIPTKAPAPAPVPEVETAPVPEVETAPVPEVETAPVPEVETAPAFEAPAPVAAPIATEAEANTAGSSASEDALNAILGASAELPSQAQEQAPAPAEPTPAPTEGEQPAE